MALLKFLAVVLTALALVPGGAHLFALPNKIAMAQDAYFVAQSVYRGWALFGIVLFGALAANAALGLAAWRRGEPHVLPLLAFLCIAATLGIFFGFTYPTNVATENWTVVPAHWDALRTRWEYSHAVNALITFAALCLVTGSVVRAPR
ncbi:MAG TPA: DUF1772 domain-containing protein [Xanthobacteraceae bacterium]|nr:DUF1772 domain-containing protein [Xanthobacteraceae bacterium]